MHKADIERLVGERVRLAAERAIVEAIGELNAAGRRFEATGDTLIEWREPGSERQLSVYCTIGVSYSDVESPRRAGDPDVERFVAQAQPGTDRAAAILSQLEGGVANGGLFQTIENNGIALLDECVGALKAIGSRTTVRIVEQACAVWREHEETLQDYEQLRRRLNRLDRRFWKLKESIAALYARTHA